MRLPTKVQGRPGETADSELASMFPHSLAKALVWDGEAAQPPALSLRA